ncbi:hypothetical protein [Synechococcus sp. CBW1108]|uniref:class I SAM-dependent methyltransferase n=1 Tax=Synechococcus sp. CBW1108 TaxID=1353147 RepID=UPI001E6424E0|nr:hypothetical protein [Synechococcus sp. CBW1108]
MSPHPCRHCGTPLEHEVIDLGHQPPGNAYLRPEQLAFLANHPEFEAHETEWPRFGSWK